MLEKDRHTCSLSWKMISWLLVGVLAIQLCAVLAISEDLTSCIKLKHEITHDEYGQRRISIECRVIKCEALEFYKYLQSIQLSTKLYDEEPMAIMERNKENEKTNPDSLSPLPALPENANLIGYTNNVKEGHMIIEWSPADYQKMETFTCTSVLLNDYKHSKTVKISLEVNLNEPTYKELKEKASSLQTEIDELKGKPCNDNSNPIYAPTEAPQPPPYCPSDEYKQKLVEKFFNYNVEGNRYYLSSYNFTDDVESDRICSVVGGYLAEINGEDELKLLLDFLKNSKALGALIGGIYDPVQKEWVFRRSGQKVDFFKWKDNKPDNPLKKNCLGLWHEYELAQKNLPCSYNMYSLPFICEVDY